MDSVHSWRGVFTIPCTPFIDQSELDLDGLASVIEFCVNAGAHGIVAPVLASEAWTLTTEERHIVIRALVEGVRSRIPVVIGVSADTRETSLLLARQAESAGGDAVIAIPPIDCDGELEGIYDFYRALSDSVQLPIFIQNVDPPYGTRLPASFVARLVREIPRVDWVKEETIPPGWAITAEIEESGPKLRGIMGGIAGRYLFDEYRRGACGFMPACEVTDVHVQVWNALDGGDETTARALFNRLLPVLSFEGRAGGVCKAVLKRRGIIASDYTRQFSGNPLDRYDRMELDRLLEDIEDLFILAPLQGRLPS
jgi:dihydrodipicolinate synthase/N-acetylneuraminate lyase